MLGGPGIPPVLLRPWKKFGEWWMPTPLGLRRCGEKDTGSLTFDRGLFTTSLGPDSGSPSAPVETGLELTGEPAEPAGRLILVSPLLASFKAATISMALCLVVSSAIFAHLSLSVAILSFLSSLSSIS